MDNKEAVLQALDEFERKPVDNVPQVLEQYLMAIAKTGETIFPWPKLKPLFVHKLDLVMQDFYEKVPTDSIPACPNVENVTFQDMRQRLLRVVNTFSGAPFTIQRLCELITNPTKHYKRTDKFLRGIEKNVLVVSTVDPFGNKIVCESKVLVNGMDTNGYTNGAPAEETTQVTSTAMAPPPLSGDAPAPFMATNWPSWPLNTSANMNAMLDTAMVGGSTEHDQNITDEVMQTMSDDSEPTSDESSQDSQDKDSQSEGLVSPSQSWSCQSADEPPPRETDAPSRDTGTPPRDLSLSPRDSDTPPLETDANSACSETSSRDSDTPPIDSEAQAAFSDSPRGDSNTPPLESEAHSSYSNTPPRDSDTPPMDSEAQPAFAEISKIIQSNKENSEAIATTENQPKGEGAKTDSVPTDTSAVSQSYLHSPPLSSQTECSAQDREDQAQVTSSEVTGEPEQLADTAEEESHSLRVTSPDQDSEDSQGFDTTTENKDMVPEPSGECDTSEDLQKLPPDGSIVQQSSEAEAQDTASTDEHIERTDNNIMTTDGSSQDSNNQKEENIAIDNISENSEISGTTQGQTIGELGNGDNVGSSGDISDPAAKDVTGKADSENGSVSSNTSETEVEVSGQQSVDDMADTTTVEEGSQSTQDEPMDTN